MIEVGYKEAKYKIPEKAFPSRPTLPKVTLLGTGGTIASRLDYRTGAVIPAFTPGELYGAVPELADICNLTTKKIFGVFSENMAMENYIVLANAIGEEIAAGADGIVIGHGTDTMGHTAAILSFMVQNSPVPIVLVGSQRSSDRPSSDAALNLIHSVRTAAYSDIAEVMICMFGPTSDRYGLLHRGTRCRKMHSSYRSTFRTIGDIPLAMVSPTSFTILNDDFRRRDKTRVPVIDPVYDDRTTILYYYPGHEARPRRRARREGLPAASSSPGPASGTSTSRSTRRSSGPPRRTSTSSWPSRRSGASPRCTSTTPGAT